MREKNTAVEVDSAGMISYHAGEPPDPRSVAVARRHGVDISGQRARAFSRADFGTFDLILAMDTEVLDDLMGRAQSDADRAKVHLFLHYAGYPPGEIVPDPYYGSQGHFEAVYRLIEAACTVLARRIG
jgi:protein-tyrosine phosphatase